jgi:hypothetical protein
MDVQGCRSSIENEVFRADQEILHEVGGSPEIGPDRIKFGYVRFLVPISPSVQLYNYLSLDSCISKVKVLDFVFVFVFEGHNCCIGLFNVSYLEEIF